MNEAELEYVGFWARTGASIIDTIIVMVVITPLFNWLLPRGDSPDLEQLLNGGSEDLLNSIATPTATDLLLQWALPTIAVAIIVVWFWLRKEATPGKMAIGARVVDAITGNAISTRQALLRYLGYFVSTVPLCLGLIWVGFDPRKQGWHDKMAGTVVVRAKNRGPQAVKFEHK